MDSDIVCGLQFSTVDALLSREIAPGHLRYAVHCSHQICLGATDSTHLELHSHFLFRLQYYTVDTYSSRQIAPSLQRYADPYST